MAVSKNPLKAVDFSSVSIKAQPVKREKQQTYAQADWSGLGDNISGIGDSVAAGYSKSKTKGPEGNTDVSKNNIEVIDKQIEAGKGKDQTNLQDRINTAKSQGKEDKVARLEGKQERRDVRQKSRAEIITAKNVDKKAKTEANRANKESKFNEKQIEKGGMVTEGYVDNLQKKSQAKNKMDASMQAASDAMGDAVTKPKQTSHTFLTAEPKTSPVLQKLGSTGKGFKLRAFRSN
jgi:hypothetical protein